MIPKEIVEKAAIEYHDKTLQLKCNKIVFQDGVQFAENYSKDLSCDFTEWIINKGLKCPLLGNFFQWQYNNGDIIAKSTQELFSIFIKEKHGKENNWIQIKEIAEYYLNKKQ